MGLFSRSHRSSTTNTYSTKNYDQSQNLADSELHQTEVSGASVLAEEIGTYAKDVGNSTMTVAGANNTVNEFDDNAANVVNHALGALESITSKNLQLQTEKDLITEKLKVESEFNYSDLKELLQNRKFQIGVGITLALFIYFKRKKR